MLDKANNCRIILSDYLSLLPGKDIKQGVYYPIETFRRFPRLLCNSLKLATSDAEHAVGGCTGDERSSDQRSYEPYELQIYSDLGTDHDDSIEILSCQLEPGESIYYKMESGTTTRCKQVVKRFAKREPTKKQKLIARIVMIVSMTMLTVSVLLVIVSLTMSEHIDDLARKITTHKIRTGLSRLSPSQNMTAVKPTFTQNNKSAAEETFVHTQTSTDIIFNTTEYNKFR
ncbi:uncharacterized protein LOC115209818 [Argonauta hians]